MGSRSGECGCGVADPRGGFGGRDQGCVDAQLRGRPGDVVAALHGLPIGQFEARDLDDASLHASAMRLGVAAEQLDLEQPGVLGICDAAPSRSRDLDGIDALDENVVARCEEV